jgi:hypothetical protein
MNHELITMNNELRTTNYQLNTSDERQATCDEIALLVKKECRTFRPQMARYASRFTRYEILSTKDYVRKNKLFMQNKANFQKVKLNVNDVLTKDYVQMDTWSIRTTKPIKANKSQLKPIQSQSKPIKANSNPNKPNLSRSIEQKKHIYHWKTWPGRPAASFPPAVEEPLHARLDFATDVFGTVADQQLRVVRGDRRKEMLLHTLHLSRPAVRKIYLRIATDIEIIARFDGGGKAEISQQLSRGRRHLRIDFDPTCVKAQHLGQTGDNAHSAAPLAKALSRHRPQDRIDRRVIARNEVKTIDALAATEPLVNELRYRLRYCPNSRIYRNFNKHGCLNTKASLVPVLLSVNNNTIFFASIFNGHTTINAFNNCLMLFRYRNFANREQAREPSLPVSNVNVTDTGNLYWESRIYKKKVARSNLSCCLTLTDRPVKYGSLCGSNEKYTALFLISFYLMCIIRSDN